MKKTIVHAAAFTLATAVFSSASYVSANPNNHGNFNFDKTAQILPARLRLVKQVFQLHIPKNQPPISQIIVEIPSTVAVSNDIAVRDEKRQKININISVDGKRIIIDFPAKNISNTRLFVEFNKVKQPTFGSASVYSFFAKVVGSDVEIPVGKARLSTL